MIQPGELQPRGGPGPVADLADHPRVLFFGAGRLGRLGRLGFRRFGERTPFTTGWFGV